MSTIDRLAEDAAAQAILTADQRQDLACDFVENELGSNDFHTNWSKIKQSGEARNRIERWLKAVGSDEDVDSIYEYVDELHAKGGNWVTPYNSRIPPAKRYVPKVSRVRKRSLPAGPPA